MLEGYLNAGKIINTHGVKGEVKVHRITDFEERFDAGNKLYWKRQGEDEVLELIIERHRVHKGFDLLTFKGYTSLDDAEPLKNGMLLVSKDLPGTLYEGEFYFHEIIGCYVYTTAGHYVGIIKEILTPGANDVWVVEREGKGDVLIPYIEDVVTVVDIERRSVIIEPMEGLLD